jgi:hypothetical protein
MLQAGGRNRSVGVLMNPQLQSGNIGAHELCRG